MKLELVQKKGKRLTWRNTFQDNENDKHVYDRNNPVGHYIYLPDNANALWEGLDRYNKHCNFAEERLSKDSFGRLYKVSTIYIREPVNGVVDNDFWTVDGDTIVDLNETQRGTKEFETKLAAIYKKALMIRFIFNEDGITLKDITYEFNCKLHDLYKKSCLTISVFNKTEGINNDPFTISGIEFEKVSFDINGITYNGLYGEGRVRASDIPKGLYKYEVRGFDDDVGRPCTIEDNVRTNFVATIFTFKQIVFDEDKRYEDISDSLNFEEW